MVSDKELVEYWLNVEAKHDFRNNQWYFDMEV